MRGRIVKVVLFALAFAFVEAAVVVYLRHLLGATQTPVNSREILFLIPGIAFLEPQTAVKIIANTAILNIERIREAATIVMLGSVALLAAGKNFKEQVAFFFVAFGIWDIFYYVFLKLTIDWPVGFTDPDIFFLLPTPWVGPVFVPILISSFLVVVSMIYLVKRREL
ncbi:MAG: hypothetical protein Q8Q49_01425 [bacterium]|nr:hypothetical protein [bacterium]